MAKIKCPMCGKSNLKNVAHDNGNRNLYLPYVDTSQNPPTLDFNIGQTVQGIVCTDCEAVVFFVPGAAKK